MLRVSSLIARVQPPVIALRLDSPQGQVITRVHSASGGEIWADVIEQKSPNEDFARKHLGPPQNGDFVVEVGSSMSLVLFDWIAASWTSDPASRDGAVLRCDPGLNAADERPFTGALLAETAFPALDGASTEGYLRLRFPATSIGAETHPGTPVNLVAGGPLQKKWLTSAFKLSIPGLDCSHVFRIEPIVVRRAITTITGPDGSTALEPGPIEFSNVHVTLSSAHAQTWFAWHDDFVIKGHNGPAYEKSGSISLRAPDYVKELARIELEGLGIYKIATTTPPDVIDSISRVTADLYCEHMTFVKGASV